MSRSKGLSSFSANFEAQISAPIDARMVVDTRSDLYLIETWTANDGGIYVYKGMIVVVHSDPLNENNGVYKLNNLPFTDMNNWEKIGGSNSDNTQYTSYIQEINITILIEGYIDLPYTPSGMVMVFNNGLNLPINKDWVRSNNRITFINHPQNILTEGDIIEVTYSY